MITTPLQPFGLSISDIEINQIVSSPSPELFTQLAQLIAVSRVVVFRNQTIDDATFIRFLSGFGRLTFTEGETPVLGAPDLNLVSNVGRVTPPRSVFHTDTSYMQSPPAFTALKPVLLPESGGDTLFTDQVSVASRLPKKMQQYLKDRTVLHQATGVDGQHQSTRQPLLRLHPITGETSLYLSTPKRCSELSGVSEHISERLINSLYRYSTRTIHWYRHQWKQGDVLMWDNRVSMHKADHENVQQDRVLHRGMVSGEVPLFASL